MTYRSSAASTILKWTVVALASIVGLAFLAGWWILGRISPTRADAILSDLRRASAQRQDAAF